MQKKHNSANIINGIETDTGNEVDTNIVDTNNVDEANTIANEAANEASGNVTDEPEEEPENNGQSNTENNSSTSEVVPGTTASREERAVELAKEYYAEEYGSTDGVYFRYDSVNSDGRYRVSSRKCRRWLKQISTCKSRAQERFQEK